MADLGVRIRVRVRPSSERQPVLVTSNPFAQLPRVLDAPRWPHMPIAAEDHERLEAVLPRAIGVRQAVRFRVLARQERHDVRSRDIGAEVRDEMTQVVLLAESNRAVGEEDEPSFARQSAHRVIGIDPGVHARRGRELRSRRTQLGGDHRRP